MKPKIFLTILCGAALLCSGIATAAPLGNPAKDLGEDAKTFSAGYEGDFVFDRELDDDSTLETTSHAGRLSYTLKDVAELFVILGAIEGENSADVSGVNVSLETDPGFLWGVGASVPLYELENGLRFGVTGNYRRSQLDISKATVGGASATVSEADFLYQAWTVGLGASRDFDWGTPYLGVKYSDVSLSDLTVSGTSYDADSNSDNVVGLFVGMDVAAFDSLALNVEGRFIDEQALTVVAKFAF